MLTGSEIALSVKILYEYSRTIFSLSNIQTIISCCLLYRRECIFHPTDGTVLLCRSAFLNQLREKILVKIIFAII